MASSAPAFPDGSTALPMAPEPPEPFLQDATAPPESAALAGTEDEEGTFYGAAEPEAGSRQGKGLELRDEPDFFSSLARHEPDVGLEAHDEADEPDPALSGAVPAAPHRTQLGPSVEAVPALPRALPELRGAAVAVSWDTSARPAPAPAQSTLELRPASPFRRQPRALAALRLRHRDQPDAAESPEPRPAAPDEEEEEEEDEEYPQNEPKQPGGLGPEQPDRARRGVQRLEWISRSPSPALQDLPHAPDAAASSASHRESTKTKPPESRRAEPDFAAAEWAPPEPDAAVGKQSWTVNAEDSVERLLPEPAPFGVEAPPYVCGVLLEEPAEAERREQDDDAGVFTCIECSIYFRRREHLLEHMLQHNRGAPRDADAAGRRRFCCGECGWAFGEPAALERHKRLHQESREKIIEEIQKLDEFPDEGREARLQCPKCVFGTNSSKIFVQHAKMHVKERKEQGSRSAGLFGDGAGHGLYKAEEPPAAPSGAAPGACVLCGFPAPNEHILKEHLRFAHSRFSWQPDAFRDAAEQPGTSRDSYGAAVELFGKPERLFAPPCRDGASLYDAAFGLGHAKSDSAAKKEHARKAAPHPQPTGFAAFPKPCSLLRKRAAARAPDGDAPRSRHPWAAGAEEEEEEEEEPGAAVAVPRAALELKRTFRAALSAVEVATEAQRRQLRGAVPVVLLQEVATHARAAKRPRGKPPKKKKKNLSAPLLEEPLPLDVLLLESPLEAPLELEELLGSEGGLRNEERRCPYCPDRFHNGIGLANHVRGHLNRVGVSYNVRHFISAEEVKAIEQRFSFQKKKKKVANFDPGTFSLMRCEFCGAGFDTRAGLSSHARAHLRDFGITNWELTVSPIHILKELLASSSQHPALLRALGPGEHRENREWHREHREWHREQHWEQHHDFQDQHWEQQWEPGNPHQDQQWEPGNPHQDQHQDQHRDQHRDHQWDPGNPHRDQQWDPGNPHRDPGNPHRDQQWDPGNPHQDHQWDPGNPHQDHQWDPGNPHQDHQWDPGNPHRDPHRDPASPFAPGWAGEELLPPYRDVLAPEQDDLVAMEVSSPPPLGKKSSALEPPPPRLSSKVSPEPPGKAEPHDSKAPSLTTCEVCGACFETRKGLSSHARSHLRQLGVAESESSGAPIDLLYELVRHKTKPEPGSTGTATGLAKKSASPKEPGAPRALLLLPKAEGGAVNKAIKSPPGFSKCLAPPASPGAVKKLPAALPGSPKGEEKGGKMGMSPLQTESGWGAEEDGPLNLTSGSEPCRDIRCEFCGEFFENRKGLSSHARSHLRQMGVTEWYVNGSPIDTLREILTRRRSGHPKALPKSLLGSLAPLEPRPPPELHLPGLPKKVPAPLSPPGAAPGAASPPPPTARKVFPGLQAPSLQKKLKQDQLRVEIKRELMAGGGGGGAGIHPGEAPVPPDPAWAAHEEMAPLNLSSRADPVRDIRCEFCGEFFENRKGLSSHARSHLRQMGVTEWSVNGSPIDTLREILRKKSKPCLIKKEPPLPPGLEAPPAEDEGLEAKGPPGLQPPGKALPPGLALAPLGGSRPAKPGSALALAPLGAKNAAAFLAPKRPLGEERLGGHGEAKHKAFELGFKAKALHDKASEACCELCGLYFENRKALASHARAHLRQFGVTEWCVNGSPIETLREWIRHRPHKAGAYRSYIQGGRPFSKKFRNSPHPREPRGALAVPPGPFLPKGALGAEAALGECGKDGERAVGTPLGVVKVEEQRGNFSKFERRQARALEPPLAPGPGEFPRKLPEPRPAPRPVPALVPRPPHASLVKFVGNIYTLKCRFCEVEFQGPLSIQEEWVRHLQRHILDMNFSKADPCRSEAPPEPPALPEAP